MGVMFTYCAFLRIMFMVGDQRRVGPIFRCEDSRSIACGCDWRKEAAPRRQEWVSNKDVADGTPACASRLDALGRVVITQPKIAVTKRVMHVRVMSETHRMRIQSSFALTGRCDS
jgi:hypothetical protein